MLAQVYAELLAELPAGKAEELLADWRRYDAAVHDEVDTVGAAGFLTSVAGEIIGFASWDPRGWPDVGQIGHHCILPGHRRRGYGRRQIEEVMRFFGGNGFRLARVRTDEHHFFIPARRLYEACGFRIVRREPGTLLDECMTVVYELELDPSHRAQKEEIDE
jgi:GNAT superfamily N-acetyltransferase